MRFPLLALYATSALAFPALQMRQDGANTDVSGGSADDFSNWSAAKTGDARSPCPCLNALANHNILPHNGKAITLDMLTDAFSKISVGPGVAKFLFNGAGKLGLLDGQILNLDKLIKHNVIEHDGSLSRADASEGNQGAFNQTIFDSYMAKFDGQDDIPIGMAGKARMSRIQTESKRDRSFTYGPFQQFASNGETALLYTVMGGVDTGVVKKEHIRVLFEEERFPYNEGWRPAGRLLSLLDVANTLVKVVVQSGDIWQGIQVSTVAQLRNFLNNLSAGLGNF